MVSAPSAAAGSPRRTHGTNPFDCVVHQDFAQCESKWPEERRNARWDSAFVPSPDSPADNRAAKDLRSYPSPHAPAGMDRCLGAPTNTPAEIVNQLNKEISAGLGDSKNQG